MNVSNRFMDKYFKMGFLGGIVVKNPPANEGDARDRGYIPGLGRSPWRRKWQPTPVFLPGEFQDRGAWWATVHVIAKRVRHDGSNLASMHTMCPS